MEVEIKIGRAVDVARDRAGLLSLLRGQRDGEEVEPRVGAHDPLVVAVVRVDPHLLVAPDLETHHGRVADHFRARVVRDRVRRDCENRGLFVHDVQTGAGLTSDFDHDRVRVCIEPSRIEGDVDAHETAGRD